MIVTAAAVAEHIRAYLAHDIALTDLVAWAEAALVDGDFDDDNPNDLARIVGRLGAADVHEFHLSWEDMETIVGELGYELHTHPQLVKKTAV